MNELKKVIYVDHVPSVGRIVLAADIGGTNSNFGICLIQDDQITILVSYHAPSKTIIDFVNLVDQVVNQVKAEYGIVLKEACFGIAGLIDYHHKLVKPTNLTIAIDLEKIKMVLNFDRVECINDFEALGYGIPFVSSDKMIIVHKGKTHSKANKAIIGAGTGLGKAIMAWSDSQQRYTLIRSEGGHADFVAQGVNDLALIDFIKDEIAHCNVSWENVLSGRGISRIFKFLNTIKTYPVTSIIAEIEDNDYDPKKIFTNWQNDASCYDTYIWYSRLYGRCAKNFTLEALSLSGLYIAGGIASKNLSLFELPGFMNEFINCNKQIELLKEVPITVIGDYNVSLYGAAAYLFY